MLLASEAILDEKSIHLSMSGHSNSAKDRVCQSFSLNLGSFLQDSDYPSYPDASRDL
jgi:hypothetical protein